MRFSILVATRNRPDDLVPCLKSLLAQEHPDFEVVVLDQSTTDASERAVREAFGPTPRLRYQRSATVGKSVALNLLTEMACGDLLACTDDDTCAPPDWLASIERAFCECPDAGVVFGQVMPGQAAHEGSVVYTPNYMFDHARWLLPGEVAGMGANMALRREVARAVRYDPCMGPGAPMPAAEEGDYVYRLQRAGVKIRLEPTVRVVHLAWRDGEEWLRVLHAYGMGDAAFALKHVRCGDWRMLRPLLARPTYILARLCYRLLCRHGHQEEHYLRGYRDGVRRSLRHRVDRRTRTYLPVEQSCRIRP